MNDRIPVDIRSKLVAHVEKLGLWLESEDGLSRAFSLVPTSEEEQHMVTEIIQNVRKWISFLLNVKNKKEDGAALRHLASILRGAKVETSETSYFPPSFDLALSQIALLSFSPSLKHVIVHVLNFVKGATYAIERFKDSFEGMFKDWFSQFQMIDNTDLDALMSHLFILRTILTEYPVSFGEDILAAILTEMNKRLYTALKEGSCDDLIHDFARVILLLFQRGIVLSEDLFQSIETIAKEFLTREKIGLQAQFSIALLLVRLRGAYTLCKDVAWIQSTFPNDTVVKACLFKGVACDFDWKQSSVVDRESLYSQLIPFGLQLLDGSVQRVRVLVWDGLSSLFSSFVRVNEGHIFIDDAWKDQKLNALIMDRIWGHWNDPIKRVAHTAHAIFRMVLDIPSFHCAQDAEFLARTSIRLGYLDAMAILVERFGADSLIHSHPALLKTILERAMQDKSAAQLLAACGRLDDLEPVVSIMCDEECWSNRFLRNYVLPAVLAADKSHAPRLWRRLSVLGTDSNSETSTARLASDSLRTSVLILLLQSLSDLMGPLDVVGQTLESEASRNDIWSVLEQGCFLRDPILRIEALRLFLKPVLHLDSATEPPLLLQVNVLRKVLLNTAKHTNSAFRSVFSHIFHIFIRRLCNSTCRSSPASSKTEGDVSLAKHHSEIVDFPTTVTFLRWILSSIVSWLRPGSSFDRRMFATDVYSALLDTLAPQNDIHEGRMSCFLQRDDGIDLFSSKLFVCFVYWELRETYEKTRNEFLRFLSQFPSAVIDDAVIRHMLENAIHVKDDARASLSSLQLVQKTKNLHILREIFDSLTNEAMMHMEKLATHEVNNTLVKLQACIRHAPVVHAPTNGEGMEGILHNIIEVIHLVLDRCVEVLGKEADCRGHITENREIVVRNYEMARNVSHVIQSLVHSFPVWLESTGTGSRLGNKLLSDLMQVKHIGAVDKMRTALGDLMTSLPNEQMSEKWLDDILDGISDHSFLRRSSGIPFVVLAALKASRSKSRGVTKAAALLRRITDLAMDEDESTRIHVLHFLRQVVLDSDIGPVLIDPFVTVMFRAAFEALSLLDRWSVRNAGLMLFAVLVKRFVEDHTSHDFFGIFGSELLSLFSDILDRRAPYSPLVVLLMSRFKVVDEENEALIGILEKIAKYHDWHEHAARKNSAIAYCSLLGVDRLFFEFSHSIDRLSASFTSMSTNSLHGSILVCHHLLLRISGTIQSHPRMAQNLSLQSGSSILEGVKRIGALSHHQCLLIADSFRAFAHDLLQLLRSDSADDHSQGGSFNQEHLVALHDIVICRDDFHSLLSLEIDPLEVGFGRLMGHCTEWYLERLQCEEASWDIILEECRSAMSSSVPESTTESLLFLSKWIPSLGTISQDDKFILQLGFLRDCVIDDPHPLVRKAVGKVLQGQRSILHHWFSEKECLKWFTPDQSVQLVATFVSDVDLDSLEEDESWFHEWFQLARKLSGFDQEESLRSSSVDAFDLSNLVTMPKTLRKKSSGHAAWIVWMLLSDEIEEIRVKSMEMLVRKGFPNCDRYEMMHVLIKEYIEDESFREEMSKWLCSEMDEKTIIDVISKQREIFEKEPDNVFFEKMEAYQICVEGLHMNETLPKELVNSARSVVSSLSEAFEAGGVDKFHFAWHPSGFSLIYLLHLVLHIASNTADVVDPMCEKIDDIVASIPDFSTFF
eukprot:TRINITY_DN3911_c0_g1_i1.p1 TRINITY_DN3911_c0_g1~~TRINITY_DN3911_c0_g1_i1.p1  ORF type:complete len:1684 (+),score=414.95 TRINITY_DN3911_c0_g1_i1:91-5142(+)